MHGNEVVILPQWCVMWYAAAPVVSFVLGVVIGNVLPWRDER